MKLPTGPENGFDERTWLRHRGVHVVLRVDEWTQIGKRGGLGGLADRLRAWLERSIAPGLGGERRAVLEGIVLGDGSQLSPGLKQDFQASGLFHILAVSGQNVVLVAAGALVLAWLLGVSRWVGELGALASIGAYVLAVGPQASVIRAGIAGALASLAWLTGRLRDAWQALLLGGVALLAWNPYEVYDPGFQLSFAAVVAIFTVVPRIARRLETWPIPSSVRLGVAVSLGCGVVTAPILWLEFGYLPLLGVPANALAEPAMPVLLGLAFATAGLESGRARRSGGPGVGERLDGRLHRVLRAGDRVAPVRRGPDVARARAARLRAPRHDLCLAAMADELKPAYLIAGTDRPKIDRAVERLRRRFGLDAVEIHHASELTGADAVAACNALGLFASEGRLIVVERVEEWKAPDAKEVADYLQLTRAGDDARTRRR